MFPPQARHVCCMENFLASVAKVSQLNYGVNMWGASGPQRHTAIKIKIDNQATTGTRVLGSTCGGSRSMGALSLCADQQPFLAALQHDRSNVCYM